MKFWLVQIQDLRFYSDCIFIYLGFIFVKFLKIICNLKMCCMTELFVSVYACVCECVPYVWLTWIRSELICWESMPWSLYGWGHNMLHASLFFLSIPSCELWNFYRVGDLLYLPTHHLPSLSSVSFSKQILPQITWEQRSFDCCDW